MKIQARPFVKWRCCVSALEHDAVTNAGEAGKKRGGRENGENAGRRRRRRFSKYSTSSRFQLVKFRLVVVNRFSVFHYVFIFVMFGSFFVYLCFLSMIIKIEDIWLGKIFPDANVSEYKMIKLSVIKSVIK